MFTKYTIVAWINQEPRTSDFLVPAVIGEDASAGPSVCFVMTKLVVFLHESYPCFHPQHTTSPYLLLRPMNRLVLDSRIGQPLVDGISQQLRIVLGLFAE